MENSEREPFDESWRSAFDGANLAPTERVWTSIEAHLAGSETATMKRRVVFYQRLAAATVLFAVLSGSYAVYNYKTSNQDLASSKSTVVEQSATPGDAPTSQSQATTPAPSSSGSSTLVTPSSSSAKQNARTSNNGDAGQRPPVTAAPNESFALTAKDDVPLIEDVST